MTSKWLQGFSHSLHNVPLPHLNQVVRHPSLVSSLHPWMLGDFLHYTPFFLTSSPSEGLSAWDLLDDIIWICMGSITTIDDDNDA